MSLKLYSMNQNKVVNNISDFIYKLIICDFDHTLTYPRKKDSQKSKFLTRSVSEILPKFLEIGPGIIICSTSHISRLIKQFSEAIDDKFLNNLIIIGEAGGVFAIPSLESDGIQYEILVDDSDHELIMNLTNEIVPLVDSERKKKNSLMFVNRDLYTHITIENFSPSILYSDDFLSNLRTLLDEKLGEHWIHISSSIEINTNEITKEFPIKLIKSSLGLKRKEIISLGDSRMDEPMFKNSIGVQIIDYPDKIPKIKYADYLIQEHIAGDASGLFLNEFLNKNSISIITDDDYKGRIIRNLKDKDYILKETIKPNDIKSHYTFPEDIKSQCEELLLK